MASFPVTDDLDALATAMNEFAQAQEEFGGQTITVRPEDVTLSSGGSLTDAAGNVFTLQPMTGVFADSPLADVYENGNLLESGQFLGGGFWDAIRLVDGGVLAENGKGLGWFGPDRNGAPDPGPGDNAGASPVVTSEPPVVTPPAQDTPPPVDTTANPPDGTVTPPTDTPPVDTTENPPVTPPDNTVSPPSDVVHAFFHHAHHGHEHRLSFIGKDTASNDAGAGGNAGHVNPAVVADLAAAALTDLTAVAGGSVSITNLVAAIGGDDSVSHHVGMIDPSIASSTQLIADCSHHLADANAATG